MGFKDAIPDVRVKIFPTTFKMLPMAKLRQLTPLGGQAPPVGKSPRSLSQGQYCFPFLPASTSSLMAQTHSENT